MTKANAIIKKSKGLSPPQIMVLGFATIIFIGSLLLSLPIAHAEGMPETFSYVDALFTATTATCVTGLVTVTTATSWTFFGQIVILVLIQLGGLSFVTILTFLALYIGKRVTIKDKITVQNTLNLNSMHDMTKMVKMVIQGTFIVEGIGAFLLTVLVFLPNDYGLLQSIYFGIFHAVSAFCNAGIDLIGEANLIPFVSNVPLNLIIMSLIVSGGIGFTVWKDLIKFFKVKVFKAKSEGALRLKTHTKLALITTGILILTGAIFFFISEYNNPETMQGFDTKSRILASFFQSITLRTAGFMTIPQSGLGVEAKLISSMFMLIGGSPGGTAGGIKTVTIAILIVSVLSSLKGKEKIEVMGREVPFTTLQKALTITIIMIFLAMVMTTLLAAVENSQNIPFVDLLFEVSSALGTVGSSAGWTASFSAIGKLILISCMFIGRLGPMTIVIVLNGRSARAKSGIKLPPADVLIG